jgi:hypothetical protein
MDIKQGDFLGYPIGHSKLEALKSKKALLASVRDVSEEDISGFEVLEGVTHHCWVHHMEGIRRTLGTFLGEQRVPKGWTASREVGFLQLLQETLLNDNLREFGGDSSSALHKGAQTALCLSFQPHETLRPGPG